MLEELRGRLKLSRARHLRIERADGTLKSRLRGLLSNARNRAIGTVASLGIVTLANAFMPTPAMAAENGMTDTTNPITNEQTVTNDSMVSDSVANAVAQAQAVTDTYAVPTVNETVTPAVTTEQVAPVVSEPVNEPVITQEQAAPVTQESAISAEQPTLAPEQTVTSANEEVNSVTATETETPEVSNEQVENVVTEDSAEMENTNNVENPEITANDTVSNEVDGIVSENPPVAQEPVIEEDTNTTEDVQVSEDVTTPITEDNMNNTTENDTVDENTQVNNDKNILENNENGYQVFEQNGQTYVVGNVSDEQLTQIVDKYGSVVTFDQNDIEPELGNGETINLGDSGYTASKDENGHITVTDAEGNLITSWDTAKEDVQDNQQTNEDSVSDFEVDTDEILLIENEDGSYTIAQGGVGLSHDQFQELVNKLEQEGKLPEDAVIVTDVLPPAPTDEMIANGQTEQSATIGDYVFSTSDGKSYQVYDKDGNLVTTITSDDYENIKDEQLGENQDISNDPDAEPDDKPTLDEPTPDEPTPDEPTPDEPTPDEPTPDEPTLEQPTPEEPTPEITYTPNRPSTLPNTGDVSMAISIGTGIAGAALAGAGAALRKRDDKKSSKGNRNLTLIEGGKGKTTYEDLQRMYDEGILINPHDYDDDLELFAEAYVLSQKQNEQMQTSKGRTR